MLQRADPVDVGHQGVERQRDAAERLRRPDVEHRPLLCFVSRVQAIAGGLKTDRRRQADERQHDAEREMLSLNHLKSRREKIRTDTTTSAAM